MTDTRCTFIDSDGCRCLLRDKHSGPHDPSYTTVESVRELRSARRLGLRSIESLRELSRRRLEAIRDSAKGRAQ